MKMTMDPECDYLSFMVTSKERVQKDGVWCELLWLQRCRHLNSTRTFPLLSSRVGQWVPTRTGRRGRQAPGQLRLKSSGLSFFPSTFRLHFLLWLQPPYFLLNPAQQKKKKKGQRGLLLGTPSASLLLSRVLTWPRAHPWANHSGHRNGMLWISLEPPIQPWDDRCL